LLNSRSIAALKKFGAVHSGIAAGGFNQQYTMLIRNKRSID